MTMCREHFHIEDHFFSYIAPGWLAIDRIIINNTSFMHRFGRIVTACAQHVFVS